MAGEGVCTKIIQSKNKTFLAFCFLFMLGAGLASVVFDSYDFSVIQTGKLALGITLVVLFFLGTLFWNQPPRRFIFITLIGFLLGISRFLITIADPAAPNVVAEHGRLAEYSGWVRAEPDRRLDKANYVVQIESVKDASGERPLLGRLLLTNRLYPEYFYGQRLLISCKIDAPYVAPDSRFRYDMYLARQGIWSVCNQPRVITILNTDFAGNFLFKYLFAIKSAVRGMIDRLWAEPLASFMAGLLYGDKNGLPAAVAENFSRTGVTHIIAVSGFNITIIATVLFRLLITVGFYRRQAFWAMLAGIGLFVLFTGASASVVRAGIMGVLVLIAQQLGRPSAIATTLVFTAASMTAVNPYVLVWDAGFQLSFLATLGLVYISPVLEIVIARSLDRHQDDGANPLSTGSFFKKIKTSIFKGLLRYARNDSNKIAHVLYENFIATLSAIIATLPLILYQFGRLSIVAPLVNVLILWIIPWLMLAGFIAVLASAIWFPFGQILAVFGAAGLQYVILIVEFFGTQSWAAVERQLSVWAMLILYGIMIWYVQRKNKNFKFRTGV